MKRKRILAWIGGVLAALIVATGIFWAFERGAKDFSVFYSSWRLVLSGWGSEIYRATPDRFLYAPGFAWVLAPLGLLQPSFALALWCLVKVVILAWILYEFTTRLEPTKEFTVSFGLMCWGVVLIARPLLIDFQYGQVNTLILGACAWALIGHVNRRQASWVDFLRWLLVTFAAVAKIFPLILLIVPWLVKQGIQKKKIRYERAGVVVGLLVVLLIPIWQVGLEGGLHLMELWKEALISKGLPIESHNQSFIAFLNHYFSGNPTHVIAEGPRSVILSGWKLSPRAIVFISAAWSLITMGYAVAWTLLGAFKPMLKWVSITIALMIVPSHLIWKPYFVMSFPIALLLAYFVCRFGKFQDWLMAVLALVLINLTGFDFLGHNWAAHFESASVLLFVHLTLIAFVLYRAPKLEI